MGYVQDQVRLSISLNQLLTHVLHNYLAEKRCPQVQWCQAFCGGSLWREKGSGEGLVSQTTLGNCLL